MKRCDNLQTAVQALFTKYKGTKYYLVAEQIKWPGGRLYEDLEAEETLDTISQISRDPEKFGFKKPVYVTDFLEYSMLNSESEALKTLPQGKPHYFREDEIQPGKGVMYFIEKGVSGIKVAVYKVGVR